MSGALHDQGHHPGHDHDHDHQVVPSDLTLRVKALESLLTEKGLVDARFGCADRQVPTQGGPAQWRTHSGTRLDESGVQAAPIGRCHGRNRELGYGGAEGEHMVVVENTPHIHTLIVCTLCSCYPWSVLGLPPVWYKSAPYRSRAVIDPRGVCGSSGWECRKKRKYASGTARLKYATWCCRSARPEAKLVENALAALVTRDAMIGVETWQLTEQRPRHGRHARPGPRGA